MDLDDFFSHVGRSRVLTSDEALDVALYMRGSTPHSKLPYPDGKRIASWTVGILEGLAVKSELTSGMHRLNATGEAQFNVYNPSGNVSVSSVYFINVGNIPIYNISVTSTHQPIADMDFTIDEVGNLFYEGHQVYEAVFNPPLTFESDSDNVIKFHSRCKKFTQIIGTGENIVQNRNVRIKMDHDNWHFVVGFKFKSSN